jgi:hypothetical protein
VLLAPPPAVAAKSDPWDLFSRERPLPTAGPADRAPAANPAPRVAAWLGPVVWGNRLFDRCAGYGGPPGRWLRGPTGRALLAWSGVLLLAAAVAFAVCDRFGWTR